MGTQPEGVRAEGTEYGPLLSDPVKGLALLLLLSPLPATSCFFFFFPLFYLILGVGKYYDHFQIYFSSKHIVFAKISGFETQKARIFLFCSVV